MTQCVLSSSLSFKQEKKVWICIVLMETKGESIRSWQLMLLIIQNNVWFHVPNMVHAPNVNNQQMICKTKHWEIPEIQNILSASSKMPTILGKQSLYPLETSIVCKIILQQQQIILFGRGFLSPIFMLQ